MYPGGSSWVSHTCLPAFNKQLGLETAPFIALKLGAGLCGAEALTLSFTRSVSHVQTHQPPYSDAQQILEARWFILLGTNLFGFPKLVDGKGWKASTPRGSQMLLSKGLFHCHHPWGMKSHPSSTLSTHSMPTQTHI